MSLSTEIERIKRGPNLEKRCRFNLNWNTVRLLGHIWSCRSWIQVFSIWMES